MAIKPSQRLATLLVLIHALVAAVVYLTALPLAVRLAILMLALLSLFYYLARDALLLLPDSWREISYEQGRVTLVARNGSCFFGQAANSATVSPYFLVMPVKLEERRLPVFLTVFPDALGADEFRDLCVRLRFHYAA